MIAINNSNPATATLTSTSTSTSAPNSTLTTTSAPSTSAFIPSTNAPANLPAPPPTSPPKLSSGKIVGAVLSSVFGFALLLALGLFLLSTRGKKRAVQQTWDQSTTSQPAKLEEQAEAPSRAPDLGSRWFLIFSKKKTVLSISQPTKLERIDDTPTTGLGFHLASIFSKKITPSYSSVPASSDASLAAPATTERMASERDSIAMQPQRL
jgi:hypothetical protein